MTSASVLDAALKRLASALDQLEAAWERRAVAERSRLDLEDSLSVLQDDRARLAVELDGATARARALEDAASEVGRRLETIDSAIRLVLAPPSDGSAEDG